MPITDSTGQINESLIFSSGGGDPITEPDPPLTLEDLFIRCKDALAAGADPDMQVICRVEAEDGTSVLGGLVTATVDPGCTDTDSFLLDGHYEVGSHADHEDDTQPEDEPPIEIFEVEEDLDAEPVD